ncbi:MAG: PilZ domain-containing protein [Terracidiphilus sp.]
MQRFEFRDPRFSCDLPVQLDFNDSKLTARCTEISNKGMKVEIEQPLRANSFGKVSMNREGQTIEFQARFAYVRETQAGLDLIYTSDRDRKTMVGLVESVLAVQGSRVRPF